MSGRLERSLVQVILVLGVVASASELAAPHKAPVPDAQALEAAQKAAGELFGARFRSAKTAADKAAVAAEMIEAALKLEDGSADQYVLLKIAREIAIGAGDAATALQAAEKQAERFDVPAAKFKAETLLAAAREARAAQHKAVSEAALQLADDWTDAGEIELPLSVCEAGRSAAQKARQFELVKELAAKADDLKKQRKAAQEYREALVVMDKDPAEPAANLTAGRYLCFVVGDWQRGVPYLALGTDAGLKAVALQELRGAASTDAQAAIGDMWWALGETRRGSERDALLLRAGAWYRQAEPRLSGGLAGLKVKQRLAELAKLGREIPKLSRAATSARPPALAIAPFDETTAKQHQAAWAKYLGVRVEVTNTVGVRLILIPPGEFEMGSSDGEVGRYLADGKQEGAPANYMDRVPAEAPKHRVTISRPFYLSNTELTQTQYRAVMSDLPSLVQPETDHPAEQISWHEAIEFCRKLSELPQEKAAVAVYRLPTEAEWEYACRAGTTAPYSFGDAPSDLTRYGWYSGNAQGRTQLVRQLLPNAWGLFDMHGNLWEWCADWYAADYYAGFLPADPQGPAEGAFRVVRGGSWTNPPRFLRSAFRSWETPAVRSGNVGFRVAADVPAR